MPFMLPEDEWNKEFDSTRVSSSVLQARRALCSTLRRAIRAEEQAAEERLCLAAQTFVSPQENGWRMQHEIVSGVKELRDPKALRRIALHAPNGRVQYVATWRLVHLGRLPDEETRRALKELATSSTNEHVVELASRMLESSLLLTDDATSTHATPAVADNQRKSVLNPQLPILCMNGIVDPDDLLDRELIEFLVHARGHEELRFLLPSDRQGSDIERWWGRSGASRLVAREDDIHMLEDYVLHGSDAELRAVAFGRLTGWWHWEKCDAYSHVTYGCTPVGGYEDERALRLCNEILVTTEPDAPWWDPTPPIDALREGARQVTEQILYGRVFLSDLTFVGERARAVAAELGHMEGIEHWLMGCLLLLHTTEDDLAHGDYPYLSIIDTREDVRDTKQKLELRGVDDTRLASALWRVLRTHEPESNTSPVDYLDAIQRTTWHGEPWEITVCSLVDTILRYPTEPICQALNRLCLVQLLAAARPIIDQQTCA